MITLFPLLQKIRTDVLLVINSRDIDENLDESESISSSTTFDSSAGGVSEG